MSMPVALEIVAVAADPAVRRVESGVLVTLVTMAWSARQRFRERRHDAFEAVHRYGGWSVLIVLTVLVGWRLLLGVRAHGSLEPGSGWPALSLMILIGIVAHPWVGVRRVPVQVLDVRRRS